VLTSRLTDKLRNEISFQNLYSVDPLQWCLEFRFGNYNKKLGLEGTGFSVDFCNYFCIFHSAIILINREIKSVFKRNFVLNHNKILGKEDIEFSNYL